MLLPMDYLAQKERVRDMLRAAERDRLVQMAKQQKANPQGWHRNLAAWMGVQMVRWGSKLQQYGALPAAASPPAVPTEYLPN